MHHLATKCLASRATDWYAWPNCKAMTKALLAMCLAAGIAVALAGALFGESGGVSAALGAAAYILPSVLFAWRLTARGRKRVSGDCAVGLAEFLLGHVLKLALATALLAASAMAYGALHWPALLLGLVFVLHAGIIVFGLQK